MTNTQLLQALYDDMQTVKKHVVSLDNRVSSLEVKMDSLDNRVSSLEVKMDSLDKKMDSLDNRVSSLEVKMDSLDKKMDSLDNRVSSLENEVSKINVTLENETNRNIKIIAEGHLDLSRKLDEAISLSSDVKAKQEIQDIYINMHQNQLKTL